MFEQRKTACGILCLVVSLMIVLIPAISLPSPKAPDPYQASAGPARFPRRAWPAGTISVNDADAETLTEINGIGETIAAMIIMEREKNGPFFYPEDLLAVRGIGNKKLQQIWPMLDIPAEQGEQ